MSCAGSHCVLVRQRVVPRHHLQRLQYMKRLTRHHAHTHTLYVDWLIDWGPCTGSALPIGRLYRDLGHIINHLFSNEPTLCLVKPARVEAFLAVAAATIAKLGAAGAATDSQACDAANAIMQQGARQNEVWFADCLSEALREKRIDIARAVMSLARACAGTPHPPRPPPTLTCTRAVHCGDKVRLPILTNWCRFD